MFDFQKLAVYHKAKDFHAHADEIIKENKFHRVANDQLTRASFSIVLNIAEGAGRFTKPDRRKFYVMARSSVYECIAIYDVLNDRKLIEKNAFLQQMELADELSRILFAMIKNLES